MINIEIKIIPEFINDKEYIYKSILKKSGLSPKKIKDWTIIKRSIDARKRPIYLLRIKLNLVGETNEEVKEMYNNYSNVVDGKSVIIIGAGPAGYFAALELIELGLRPIIFERGQSVQNRRRDLKAIQQLHTVNPESNYCFGEGGAGTYSDGKLYTRANKRGNVQKVLQIFVNHGASTDIMIDAHPHIGSNKLPKVIQSIRQTINSHGGQVHFGKLMTDLIIKDNRISGVVLDNKQEVLCDHVILATGHSARDIYKLLHKKQIKLESKAFAIGVRIEHPQELIDKIQYGQCPREENLPASTYSLNTQIDKRGVFSFCMCPGGLIVPAMTNPGEIVVNGMSLSRRNSKFANSGTVVTVDTPDFGAFKEHGALAGMYYQESIEQAMFKSGSGDLKAPSQRLVDFVNGTVSKDLNPTSYMPGLNSIGLHEILPSTIYNSLKRALPQFGKKMKGYFTNEANVIATESRTSAPLRIPRDKSSLMHEEVVGLYPCGEGAGYAGGIMSAALDGQRIAQQIARIIE